MTPDFGFDPATPTSGGQLPPPAPQPRNRRDIVDPLRQFAFTNPPFRGPAAPGLGRVQPGGGHPAGGPAVTRAHR